MCHGYGDGKCGAYLGIELPNLQIPSSFRLRIISWSPITKMVWKGLWLAEFEVSFLFIRRGLHR